MPPTYNLEKIKFATDTPTWQRAVDLYEKNKVTDFTADHGGYYAIVLGGSPYHVVVSDRSYNQGNCDCYLGQRDELCKHMVAVAIKAVLGGRLLTAQEKQQQNELSCSGRKGVLDKEELANVKKSITSALRYIKPYVGSSRTWFANQNSLEEGCNRLAAIFSKLPISKQTAELVIKSLLRIEKKFNSGIDDSNGIVGGFMMEVVEMLKEYVKLAPECLDVFSLLCNQSTCFGWESQLVRMYDEKDLD